MIGKYFYALAFALSLTSLSAQNGSKSIELEDIISGRFYAYGAGYGMRSMADGEYYTLISKERDAILRYSYSTGQLVDSLFDVKSARECPFRTFDDYEISPDGKHILLYTELSPIYRRSTESRVFHYDTRRRLVSPLSDKAGKVMIPTFSPDGRMVAFVRDNNIFIKKFDFDTEVQVTTDGKRNAVINGATDWVYEEEFAVTKQMSWSEDGTFLSWVRSDESSVSEYRMPMYQGKLYPEDYVYKYPKAGEQNSSVSVHIYSVADRRSKRIALKPEESYYIPRISYIGRGQTLAVMTLNRRQNHFRIFYVNSKSLVPKTIFEEKSESYIDSEHIASLRFTPQGFAYVSERSGWAQLYLFDDRGQLQRRLTNGAWDVKNFYGIDASGNAYLQAADKHPTESAVYSVSPKGKQTLLGQASGVNDAHFSEGFRYFIASHSTIQTPTQTQLYRTDGNRLLRTLEDNARLREELTRYRLPKKELTTIKTASGLELNAWVIKPLDLKAEERCPVLIVQYSGPNSQQVFNSFGIGWEYYLASQGIAVVSVDGRGTGARGEAWRKGTYLQLGIQESEDQAAAAQALAQLPWIDGSRIGIWGWSFGGYNTLMSLIHGGGIFKLGIAVAPVTDWRFYDTIYTERFMRTPQENPEGYRLSSVLESANKLRGKLLLIHGSADDNVHVQNSHELERRLTEANIPFEMAIYTDKDHSIRGGNTRLHLYRKMAQYLLDNL